MRQRFFISTICVLLMSGSVYAQHSDIEFGYDNTSSPTAVDIEASEFTVDNIMVFEGDMEDQDPFAPIDWGSTEPGFATNDLESLLVNAGDNIFLNALDASVESAFGVGYVNYYNPLTDALEASGRLSIIDNSSLDDLVLNGGGVESGPTSQFLGTGDVDGDIHDHVTFDLLDDASAPLGAYGILFELQADFSPADGNIDLVSDKFWIVLNHGMDEEDFENLAIPKFGVNSVPEPATASVLLFGMVCCLTARRRS